MAPSRSGDEECGSSWHSPLWRSTSQHPSINQSSDGASTSANFSIAETAIGIGNHSRDGAGGGSRGKPTDEAGAPSDRSMADSDRVVDRR
ncbi:MAG: hypothetical protein V2A73_20500 [Pseudomonadota bacterium]